MRDLNQFLLSSGATVQRRSFLTSSLVALTAVALAAQTPTLVAGIQRGRGDNYSGAAST